MNENNKLLPGEKYVWRVYKTTNKPSINDRDKAHRFISPYMDSAIVRKKYGEPITTRSYDKGDLEREYIMRAWDDNTPRYSPHKGISVVGLDDPRFSIYHPEDYISKLVYSPDGTRLMYNTNFEKAVPNSYFVPVFQKMNAATGGRLQEAINDVMKGGIPSNGLLDITEYFDNPSEAEINAFLAEDAIQWYNRKHRLPRQIAPDTRRMKEDNIHNIMVNNNRYDSLLTTLQRLVSKLKEDKSAEPLYSNKLFLAAVPESALVHNTDILTGKQRGQRDFKNELITRRLRILDNVDNNTVNINGKDYSLLGSGRWGTYKSKFGWKLTTNDNIEGAIDAHVEDMLNNNVDNSMDRLTDARSKLNATDADNETSRIYNSLREKASKKLIYDLYDLEEGDNIVSDDDLKYIYEDLSDWYNNKSTVNNIIAGIKELGQ